MPAVTLAGFDFFSDFIFFNNVLYGLLTYSVGTDYHPDACGKNLGCNQ